MLHSRLIVAGEMCEYLGRLLDAQAAEEPQLDDARLTFVEGGEPLERLVEGKQVDRAALGGDHRFVERHLRRGATPFDALVGSRVVDENPAHRLRRDPEEVRAVLPPDVALLDELHKRLVDQRRRLERVVLALAPQVARGAASQLAVDQREELVERVLLAGRQIVEQARDVDRRVLAIGRRHVIASRPRG